MSSSVLSFGVDVLLRGLVLTAIGWGAAAIVARRSASQRAAVWTCAFAALVALPIAAATWPSWRIAIMPAVAVAPVTEGRASNVSTAPSSAAATTALEAQTARGARRASAAPRVSAVSTAPALGETASPTTTPTSASTLASALVTGASLPLTPVAAAAPAGPTSTRWSLARMAFAVWGIGAAVLLVRLCVARIAAARLVRQSTPLDNLDNLDNLDDTDWQQDVQRAAQHFGVARPILVRATDAVAVPAVIGIRRPALLVPMDAGEWPADVRHLVLMHEIAHVARWDAIGQLASQLACALYWCVPPVWLAASRAAALREQATDDAVLRAGVRPTTYAANLIDLANAVAGRHVNAASLAMSASRIQERVTAILDPAARRTRTSRVAAASLLVAATAGVAAVAAVTPAAQTFTLAVPKPPMQISAGRVTAAASDPAAPSASAAMPASAAIAAGEQWPPMTAVPPIPPVPPTPPAGVEAPATPALPATPTPPTAPIPMTPHIPMAPQAPMAPPAPMAPLSHEALQPVAPLPPTPSALAAPRAPSAPAPLAWAPLQPTPPVPPAPMANMSPMAPGTWAGNGTISQTSTNRASAICQSGRTSIQNSSTSNNGDVTWRMKVSGPGCVVEITSHGKVEFNDAFTDIARISNNGDFHVTMTRDGSTRSLDVESRNGTLARTYKVNGASMPVDAAWFANLLISLDREFAIGVEQRLPILLKQGGVAGVLKETALMPSDFARDRYYRALAAARTLTSAETVQVLQQAASMDTSDYYAAELLTRLGPTLGSSAPETAAIRQIIAHLSSDYYVVEALKGVYRGRRMTSADVPFAAETAARLRSDYYKYELLQSVVHGTDGASVDAFAAMLATMKEDYYIGEAIRAIADRGLTPAGRRAAIDAAKRMHSGYYVSEAIIRLAADPKLSEQDRQALVDAANGIREASYRERALQRVRGR